LLKIVYPDVVKPADIRVKDLLKYNFFVYNFSQDETCMEFEMNLYVAFTLLKNEITI
jgi:hypothetical protein